MHRARRSARRLAILLLALSAAVSSCQQASTRDRSSPRSVRFPADDPSFNDVLSPDTLDVERLGAALFHETNRVRRAHRLPTLHALVALDEAADLQASSSALKRAADHTHLLPPLATPPDRIRHVGLDGRAVGENAALLPFVDVPPEHGVSLIPRDGHIGYYDGWTGEPAPPHTYASFAATALQAWLDSPPHRAALLNPIFRYVGCSVRPTRQISGAEMLACIQVFYTR